MINLTSTKEYKLFRSGFAYLLLVATSLFILANSPEQTQASASAWSEPVNLSYSGSATAPLFITDSAGNHHVLWQDAFDGFMYTTGNGVVWEEPQAIALPFSFPPFSSPTIEQAVNLYTPMLKIDNNDMVHAFWLDNVGAVVYSRVPVSDIGVVNSWLTQRLIAESTSAFDIGLDDNGRLHLSYVRTHANEQFPAGVYHRQSNDSGDSWSDSKLLYESRYLRLATREESNIQLTADNEKLVVVWDNRLIDAVYLTASQDSGNNWTLPQKIDQRTESETIQAVGPSHITAVLLGGVTHIVWQAGHESGSCALYHQYSINDGQSWSQPLVAADDRDCPENVRLLTVNDMLLMAYTLTQESIFQAWHGTRWTTPLIQSRLSSFTDPDLVRAVRLGCLQLQIASDTLTAIGCGLGTVQDIWLMSYPLLSLENQILSGPEAVWSSISPISNSPANKSNPVLLTTADGNFHAFWIEKLGSTIDDDRTYPGDGIYYSSWDGHEWRRPAPIYLDEHVDQLTAAVYENERFILVWRDPHQDALILGQATIAQARIPAQWSLAKELVTQEPAVSNPILIIGHDKDIYLVYSLALNEGRGIYLIDSKDGGLNWSEPRIVFDAKEKDWGRVGQPQLTVTENGRLHILISQYRLTAPPDKSSALFYIYSLDDDLNHWSEADLVAAENIAWGQIASTSYGQVYRLWQERIDDRTSLWFQTSIDNGISWSQSELIPAFDDLPGILTVYVSKADQVHLIQLTSDINDPHILREWLYEEERWRIMGALDLSSRINDPFNMPALAVSPTGQLGVLYPGKWEDTVSGLTNNNHFFANRQVILPEDYIPPVLPSPTPTSETLTDFSVTDSALGDAVVTSPTPLFELEDLEGNEATPLLIGTIDLRTPTGGIFLGIVLSSLLVISVFSIGYYSRRTKR